MIRHWNTRMVLAAALFATLGPPRAFGLQIINDIPEASSIWQWVATAGLFLAFVAVVFKNAKRSHDT